MAESSPILVWFRNDLRIADNPALHEAAASGRPVVPIYVLEPGLGGAARWWLHHSLEELAASLGKLGGKLVLRQGPASQAIPALINETGAGEIHWNRRYDAPGIETDRKLKQSLGEAGITATSHKGSLLFEPWEVKTGSGGPFQVFTPFWRTASVLDPGTVLPAPTRLRRPATMPRSEPLEAFGLLPTKPDWAGGLRADWRPGEAAARAVLESFVESTLDRYHLDRDRPDRDQTSRLSPRLRWGELSPRQVWHAVSHEVPGHERASRKFLSELGWREFSYHLLYQHPDLDHEPIRPAFRRFPWQPDPALFKAWQQGRTGYAIVDAGMRQLWTTGWMHNRVRMIAASLLVKHLLQPWADGAAWFMDTLVDADPASNAASWQWVAGCGADAAPYFRIFNPVLQGRKFDPDGAYVRRWVPERGALDTEHIHEPIEPLIGLMEGRDRALAAFAALKDGAPTLE